MQRSVKLAKEKGSSSWLTALPLKAHSFILHKQAFRGALALHYGWTPKKLPSKCACGSSFTVQYAVSCAKGRYPSIRHNEIQDLTANLISDVFHNEPELLPVTGENLSGASANTQPGAWLDIAANGVWGGSFEQTYFDVRIFNPHVSSNRHMDPQTVYRKHKQSKKRAYEQTYLTNRTWIIYPVHSVCYLKFSLGGHYFLQGNSRSNIPKNPDTPQNSFKLGI